MKDKRPIRSQQTGFKRSLLFFALALILIILDQLSKAHASNLWLNQVGSFSLPITNEITLVTGILFVTLSGYFLAIGALPRVPLMFLVAGGASNTLDRLIWSGVRDIWHIGSASFNLADILVTIGVIFLLERIFCSDGRCFNLKNRHFK